MRVIGLDLSLTGTGVVDDGSPRTITTKLKDEARLDFIIKEILGLVEQPTDLVVIEGLAFGTQTGKAMERAGLHYMVRTELWRKNIPFAIAPPTCVKKWATGKGNAAKDEIMIAVVKLFPDTDIKNNNESDAMAIWSMGMEKLGSPVLTLPKLNKQAIDKVAWPEGL